MSASAPATEKQDDLVSAVLLSSRNMVKNLLGDDNAKDNGAGVLTTVVEAEEAAPTAVVDLTPVGSCRMGGSLSHTVLPISQECALRRCNATL